MKTREVNPRRIFWVRSMFDGDRTDSFPPKQLPPRCLIDNMKPGFLFYFWQFLAWRHGSVMTMILSMSKCLIL